MKLSGREDFDAPLAQAWAALSDFDALELLALRRGVEVTRTGAPPALSWNTAFEFRGKRRQVEIRLQRIVAEEGMEFGYTSAPAEGSATVELVALSPARTRLIVSVEVKPRTMAARLFLQSLKLAKGRVTRRFAGRVAKLARLIEARAAALPPQQN